MSQMIFSCVTRRIMGNNCQNMYGQALLIQIKKVNIAWMMMMSFSIRVILMEMKLRILVNQMRKRVEAMSSKNFNKNRPHYINL